MDPFADRLTDAVERAKSRLVVGLDPRLERTPAAVRERAGRSPERLLALFCREVIDAVAPFACAVKPQIAFFEAHGVPGLRAYARVLRHARARGLLAIADAKRGDVAATAEAYARAHLAPPSRGALTFSADAVTAHPYLGRDSLEPLVRAAAANGKGVFVLVRTSNASAAEIQDAEVDGEPLYLRVARTVRALGEPHRGRSGYSCVGAVVGATAAAQAARAREALPWSILLVPGLGAQGARGPDVVPCFHPGGRGAVVNASRSILYPPGAESSGGAWADAVAAAARAARDEIDAALRI